MRRTYPARTDPLPLARRNATHHAKELGADDSLLQAIALAVSETRSNVVVHAYRHSAGPGEMAVALERPDDHVCVHVVDDGIGMQPRLDTPGLGLGIPTHLATDRRL